MKFTKATLAGVLMMMVMSGRGQGADTTSTTTTLTIHVTFTQPGCNIQVPSSYNLGTLTPGEKEHEDLKITWTCEGDAQIKTALTASIVTGIADGDNKVRLMSGGQATGAELSLRDKSDGTLIKLTGHEAKDYFCSDSSVTTGMRTCTLTPVTKVDRGTFGLVSATLNFAVAYP